MGVVDVLAWRPKLRNSLVVEQDGQELLFISTSDRRVKRFAASPAVFRMIPLLDGTHSVADLVGSLCGESEELVQEVCGALATLREEQLLSKVTDPVAGASSLTPAQLSRYDRQIRLFQEFCDSDLVDYEEGLTAQERLGSATVLVCGVGGLGSVVASSLAASGVGTLIVCDDDVVEEGNLTHPTYSLDDIGLAKVEALTARLSRMNPHISVRPEKRRVEHASDLADLVTAADLVISCADQPSINEMAEIMTEACWPSGTPHLIGGGYAYHVGILGLLVIPRTTACWHCMRAEFAHEHGRDRSTPFVRKSLRPGIIGAQSGIIGNMMAWEGIRFLTGMGTALGSRWIELNYGPMTFSEREVPRRADCPWCA